MRKVELKISFSAKKFDKAAVSILKENQISRPKTSKAQRCAPRERQREFPGGPNFALLFSISLPLAPRAKVEMSAALLSDQNSPSFRRRSLCRRAETKGPGRGKNSALLCFAAAKLCCPGDGNGDENAENWLQSTPPPAFISF
jgi:hypothetical protein